MKSALILLAVIASTNANLSDALGGLSDLTKKATEGVIDGISSVTKLGGKGDSILDKKLPRIPVEELIKKEGFPVESYYVTTIDGYILRLFRIPYGKTGKRNDKVVYLQHGLLASCTDWILFGEKRALAYTLANEGYDVWLGNCRGNFYSRNHTKLDAEDSKFWQFSWHEIGVIDIPTMIDFILEKTGKQKLYHIGHSQGTTSFYVMTSMNPEYNDKIEHHISLAPIGFMDHLHSLLIRMVAIGTFPIGLTLESLGRDEFMPEAGLLNFLSDVGCSLTGIGRTVCQNALFAVAGYNPEQIKPEDIPLIMAYYPAGAATKQIVHYGQEVNSGKFCQYDFGKMKNTKIYGDFNPPEYALDKITAPITLIYSANDWLSAEEDVKRLAKKLKNLKEIYMVPNAKWNHVDYLFGKDVNETVYRKVLDVLARF